ncbi:hypothetical protein ANCCEY_13436 [Ancylostoma ceylanicum]|uniref:Uncharacterized protein n=1 Tax=Ancylostoma ceylanicum TaxID=53326 RepID=A0A0D6L700_9BILA|nr:hypothetical protein ANCCEY_13436 [Ancylostoma ceylanicum]
MPAHMGPPVLARGILARVLLQSGCHQFELKRVDPTPRAEYEEQASEYWYFITLTPEGDEEQPQHNNVTLTSMAIGNMPNPGIFFVRGDYVTNYNEISNRRINEKAGKTAMKTYKVQNPARSPNRPPQLISRKKLSHKNA